MSKAPPLPAIVIANDLLEGDVVFLGASGWVRQHREAQIAHSEAEADALLARAAADSRANLVVEAYLAEVRISDQGTAIPVHYREKMRTLGPTIRPDLGKQAEA